MTNPQDNAVAHAVSWSSETRLESDVATLCTHTRSRVHNPAGIEAAEQHILHEWQQAGLQPERMAYTFTGVTFRDPHPLWLFKLWPYTWARNWQGANLVARIPANTPHPDGIVRPILVGAHYDTVSTSVGADDNASGVAILLELARILPSMPLHRPVILCAFDHEELGKIGSRKAAAHFATVDQVSGMVNLESLGVFHTEPHTQRVPEQSNIWLRSQLRDLKKRQYTGDSTAVVTRPGWSFVDAYLAAADAVDGPGSTILVTDRRPRIATALITALIVRAAAMADRSDHAAFWKRRIPAVMLTTTAPYRNDHYHRPTDTPDRLDYTRLKNTTAALAAALSRY